MVHGIGTIPGIIVIVIIIFIMNNDGITTVTPMIASMVIIIIMMIDTNCHYCKCRMIRRIISIIIGRIIGHINRRIYILYNRC